VNYYLGIDFGTSGARAIAINDDREIVASVNHAFPNIPENDLAVSWETALFNLLDRIPQAIITKIKAISIDGTSATVLLCDRSGYPITKPLLYKDAKTEVLETLKEIAPPKSPVINSTSSLAKLLWWSRQSYFSQAAYFLHQADWLAWLLHDKLGISDYHNALKLGYDVENLEYPIWLQNLAFNHLYPQIIAPGQQIATIKPEIGDRFGLPLDCIVRAGTTDSIAAFLASGATQTGEAVTSLGSTLVIKLLSKRKIENSSFGIYSHRLGNLWLTGGASNTGGAVLKSFFNDAELSSLSQQIPAEIASPLNYYPLLEPGERFPISNPQLLPQLEPRPSNSVEFLHGLLESISRIEALGYQKLQQLGANPSIRVYTAGGGAKNFVWQQIRQRHLQVPIIVARNTQAAYGAALLASNIKFSVDTI
jgi:sugar (pentulose or hexulose) kinase